MEIARHWRLRQQRYNLQGEHCNNCDSNIFPPRDVCPHCGGTKSQEVVNFKGPMVPAQLTDVEHGEVEIGMPVEMVTRKLKVDGDEDRGQIIYGYKFRPPVASSSSK